MSQSLLDSTAESVSVTVRLRFLRNLEDSQTPIIFVDRQGKKHLVYVTKIVLLRPEEPLDEMDETHVQVTLVDADDLFWPQPKNKLTISVSVNPVLA